MKKPNQLQNATRFDFSKDEIHVYNETATLRELLDEIDSEQEPGSLEVNLDSLEANLEFVGLFTGRVYASLSEPLPLRTLKTIKLLYQVNKGLGTQLFRHLRSPQQGERATLEVPLTGVKSRNQSASKAFSTILSKLSLEISQERLDHIQTCIPSQSDLLNTIAYEEEKITHPIKAKAELSPLLVQHGIRSLASAINLHRPPSYRHASMPLNEALYTHILKLPFLHFAAERRNILQIAKLSRAMPPITADLARFCSNLSKSIGVPITPRTPFMSVEAFPAFTSENRSELALLVAKATGIPTKPAQLLEKQSASSKILYSYIFHQGGRARLSDIWLSASDCVAALCTVRQLRTRSEKISYTPSWIGQTSDEISSYILGQLDESRSIEELHIEDYIPHGTLQVIYNRFCAIHAAILGRLDEHEAWHRFRLARLEAYARCLGTPSIDSIGGAVRNLNDYCESFAILIANQYLAWNPAPFGAAGSRQ